MSFSLYIRRNIRPFRSVFLDDAFRQQCRPNRRIRSTRKRQEANIFDFVYSIFQKNNASFSLPRALSSLSCLGGGIIDAEGGDGRRRRNDGGTAERRGISWISQRVAVTVSVMGFGSVVESYSCANPISGLLRVYFSHTRRADRGNGEGFSIAGKQISPRDRYRSLLSRDKRSPRVPRIFHSLSLSFPPRSKSTIFARYLLLEIREYTYLPTYTSPSIRSLYFFRRGIFFFDLLRRRPGRAKGRRVSSRVYREGDSSVYLRIACRLSIEPFVQPRVKSLRIDSKIRFEKRCGVTNDAG